MVSLMKLTGLKQRQRGVGLVEIMISLVLGLLVTGRHRADLPDDQAPERHADQPHRAAGVRALRRPDHPARCPDGGLPRLSAGSRLRREHAEHANRFSLPLRAGTWWASRMPPAFRPVITNVVADTDVLTLRTVDDPGHPHDHNMASSSADPVTVAGLEPAPFAANDIALITDCWRRRDLPGHRLQRRHRHHRAQRRRRGARQFQQGTWHGASPPGPRCSRIRTTTYYIRESANGTGPALWRRSGLAAGPGTRRGHREHAAPVRRGHRRRPDRR